MSLDIDDKGLIGAECKPFAHPKSQLAGLLYRFCGIKMCRTMRASPLSPYLRNVQIKSIDGSLRHKGDDWIVFRRELQVCLGHRRCSVSTNTIEIFDKLSQLVGETFEPSLQTQ